MEQQLLDELSLLLVASHHADEHEDLGQACCQPWARDLIVLAHDVPVREGTRDPGEAHEWCHR